MKKITAFIGSARRGGTYRAIQAFESALRKYEEIEFESVFLNDYDIHFCNGCKVCFDKGEEYCPLKDDRDILLDKIHKSDGVIFASPNYAFQVSARMKNFLDRTAYFFHRPHFFDKTFTAIITQGVFGGKKIQKYLEKRGDNYGFQITKGACMNTLEPMTGKQKRQMEKKIKKAARRFYSSLQRETLPSPPLLKLMMFRIVRKNVQSIDQDYRDYSYFKEKDWFESDYYHETSLGFFKKMAGRFFDFLGSLTVKST